MEFWGVEVKPGQPLKVQPEFGKLIHISQAALDDVKDVKGAKRVPLRLKVDNKDYIVGYLSAEDRTQVMLDLVFEKEFEISHDWKNGSVHVIGYIADDPVSDDEEFSDEFDDDSEDEPLEIQENGKIKPETGVVKAAAAAAAKSGTKKEEQSDSDDDEDEDDDSDDEMAIGEEDLNDVSGEDSEEDGDEDEEEELPKQSKKRPAPSTQGTPATKKAKSATPDKTGNKKAATPVPPKSGGQTPKSGGQVSRKSSNKSFNSDKGFQSRGKGKHGRK